MHDIVKDYLEKLHASRKKHSRTFRALAALSVVVAFGVTWQLRLTGLSMTGQLYCGLEEHTHSADCIQRTLVCPQEEYEGHTHTERDGCYDIRQTLTCPLSEHTHGDDCFGEDGELLCTQEEHTHGDDCFETERTLVCELEESPGHTHTDDCYEVVYLCGFDYEHTHSAQCGSDEEADVETAADWQATLPRSLTGDPAHDLAAVAQSQIGYKESTDNFQADADGGIRGYTRYGAWYGNPYGPWNAMFVSFCLHYANISERDVPQSAGCYAWTTQLDRRGLLREPGEHAPAPGDLVFFDRDGNGRADRVAIVVHVSNGGVMATEGDVDGRVAHTKFDPSDGTVLAYGVLPDASAPELPPGPQDEQEEPPSGPPSGEQTPGAEEPSGPAAPLDPEPDAQPPGEPSPIPPEPEEETPTLPETPETPETSETPGEPDAPGGETPDEETPDAEAPGEGLPGEEVPDEEVPDEEVPGETPEEPVLTQATVRARLYADDLYEEPLDDAYITVSGLLPEGLTVFAFPAEVEFEDKLVLWAYDITLFTADGEPWQPLDDVLSVHVTQPWSQPLEEDSEVGIYYVPEHGEAEPVSATVRDGWVTFDAEHFSVYAAAVGLAALDQPVTSAEDLPKAFTGGTVTLGADLTVSGTIELSAGEHILDLNGHTLTVTGADALFHVTGGSLTIMDPQADSDADPADSLTYTVTESTVFNSATGETAETTREHTVPLHGCIAGGSGPIVSLSGGSFTLESGALTGGTGRAVVMDGGTAELQGGHIYGFEQPGPTEGGDARFGGAVRATGGTLNISGTVLANNSAPNGGAIYAKGNTEIRITDGVISGNTANRRIEGYENAVHNGGGGLYCAGNTAVVMSGGYLTNNMVTAEVYFDGGGGAMLTGSSSFTLEGGYITGNEASGGGGLRTDFGSAATITMSGGFVSGNTARSTEGGGIAIDRGCTGEITGGYITNNITNTSVHWGGGGVFCADGAFLRVYHVLVTDNDAGGFGGGVAGCSTGRVYICVKDGGAIYANDALGQHLSGNGSQKNEDHLYAASSPVFMNNGYKDYFCALNSLVEGGMLGGGTANWSGSLDGVEISNVPHDATLEAAYVMGLTAHPSEGDIAAAREKTKVFINGNSSYTHGGGILCNGYLLVGDKNPIAVGSRLTLEGTKKLIQNGKDQSLDGYTFTFQVTDEDGDVVSSGTSGKDGSITFDRLLSFTEELCKPKIPGNSGSAEFVYYVTEQPSKEHPEITIDGTTYRITVTITAKTEDTPFEDEDGNIIERVRYEITGVTVHKSADQETWEAVSFTYTKAGSETKPATLKITNSTTFTNEIGATTSVTVYKVWEHGANPGPLPPPLPFT